MAKLRKVNTMSFSDEKYSDYSDQSNNFQLMEDDSESSESERAEKKAGKLLKSDAEKSPEI